MKQVFPIPRYGPLDKPHVRFAEWVTPENMRAKMYLAELDLRNETVRLPLALLTFEEIKALALLIDQWEANGKRY